MKQTVAGIGSRRGGSHDGCDRNAAGRFAALCPRDDCCWAGREARKSACWRCAATVLQQPAYGRLEMSTPMKNKSLLLLPIGLAILIVIGILTS
jgi:hypothetical protein